MSASAKVRRCPICKKTLADPPDRTWFPFCSHHCKLIDLNNWLSGNYRVPVEGDDGDAEVVSAPGKDDEGPVH